MHRRTYTIDDGTGETSVIRYTLHNEHTPIEFYCGQYIAIHGEVILVDGEKVVLSHHIRKITNYNEITYHFLNYMQQFESLKSLQLQQQQHEEKLQEQEEKSQLLEEKHD